MEKEFVDGITVDAERAKDLDDAFWVEKTENEYRLTISISDVSSLIPVGSLADEAASGRGQSMYTGTTMKTGMLDSHIARGKASLLPARRRNVISLKAVYSLDGDLLSYEFLEAVLVSRSRLSYELYDSIFEQCAGPFSDMVQSATHLARLLWSKRMRDAGKIEWDSAFDPEGNLRPSMSIGALGKTVVHEFMVTVNALSTELVCDAGWPMIFRNQGPRPGGPSGRFEIVCYGHGTNATTRYGQFSSPIRRYTDLVNQRILKALMASQLCPYDIDDLAEICARSNRTAQLADTQRRSEGEFDNKGTNKTAISSLCPIGFRRFMSFQTECTDDIRAEIQRRIVGGLMYHRDFADMLFGNNGFMTAEEKCDLINRLHISNEDFQRVWIEAVNIGLISDVCSRTERHSGLWTAVISCGEIVSTRTSRDPLDARMNALRDISIRVVNGNEGYDAIHSSPTPIVISDDKVKWHLGNLCRVMGWEHPIYDVVSKGTIQRPIYRCEAKVGLDTFVYESPFVHSSSIRGAEMAAANLSLAALQPYAKKVMMRSVKHRGVHLSCLTDRNAAERPMTAVMDFCHLYNIRKRIIWLQENPAPDVGYVCQIELNADGKSISAIGSGVSRIIAMENSARETIQSITASK